MLDAAVDAEDKIPSHKRVASYLTRDEVDAILDAELNEDRRLFMLLLWRTGLRVSEAIHVRTWDLRLNEEPPILLVRRAKGRKQREVPVHPELRRALKRSRRSSERGRLWTITRGTAWQWVKHAIVRADIDFGDRKISPHSFRHGFGRYAALNGIPTPVLQRWMGHERLETTERYMRLAVDPLGYMERLE